MNTEMQTDAARRVSSSSGRDSISGVHTIINIDSLNHTGWKHGCLMMQYQLQWLLNVDHDDRRTTYAYSDWVECHGKRIVILGSCTKDFRLESLNVDRMS
jgi:hypothetical protein